MKKMENINKCKEKETGVIFRFIKIEGKALVYYQVFAQGENMPFNYSPQSFKKNFEIV